jgi:hypothetical protein
MKFLLFLLEELLDLSKIKGWSCSSSGREPIWQVQDI